MANNAMGGFRWKRSLFGKPQYAWMPVVNNNATGIFKGDVLELIADGTVQVAAADASNLIGIACGAKYWESGKVRYNNFLPAATTFSPTTVGSPKQSLIHVLFASGQIFEADMDAALATPTAAGAQSMVGQNTNHVVGSGGNTTTGLSSHALDADGNTTATAAFKILGVAGGPNFENILLNDVTLTRAKFDVQFNESYLAPYQATGI